MKKFGAALAATVAAAAVAVGVAFGGGGGGTVAYEGFACGLFDGNGNIFITYDSQTIVYSNQLNSKAVLRCEGWGAPAASLTYLSGFLCGTQFGFTYNTVDKIGRNGNSQLTCTVDLNGVDNAASSSSFGAVSG